MGLKMLKGVMGNVILLGLSFHNIDRLITDKGRGYIRVDAAEVSLPHDIILRCGKADRGVARDNKTGDDVILLSMPEDELMQLRDSPCKAALIIEGDTIAGPTSIIIFGGETELTMASALSEFVGANTQTKIDPRLLN
jgi:hypothetical protein